MLPSDLKQFRKSIFHTQREFADLLSSLRGAPISFKAIEHWEGGRRRIMLYQTDLAAISEAIRPQGHICQVCGAASVVRKNHQDLCATCATPFHQGQRPRLQSPITNHQEIAAAIQPFLTRRATA